MLVTSSCYSQNLIVRWRADVFSFYWIARPTVILNGMECCGLTVSDIRLLGEVRLFYRTIRFFLWTRKARWKAGRQKNTSKAQESILRRQRRTRPKRGP